MKRNVAVVCVYLILIAVGIPWYWPADSTLVILGFPAWVLVAILVSLMASVFTAWLLLSQSWDSEDLFDE